MSEASILLQIEDGVALITLNRPAQLNSFNETMHLALADAMAQVESDDSVRCVLITGAGRGFCAGQDLSDRNVSSGAEAPDLGASIERFYNPLVRRIVAMEKPVICAVNGVAAGAGANIALACDLVIAAESASFIQAFCRLGLVPDSGGTWFLPQKIGQARAMGLALLGDKLPAQKAKDWGLIWDVAADDALAEQAMTLAKHLATQPTKGLARVKKAIRQSASNDLDTQLDLERDLQREAGTSPDYREGVAAFMEKRKPEFTGQ